MSLIPLTSSRFQALGGPTRIAPRSGSVTFETILAPGESRQLGGVILSVPETSRFSYLVEPRSDGTWNYQPVLPAEAQPGTAIGPVSAPSSPVSEGEEAESGLLPLLGLALTPLVRAAIRAGRREERRELREQRALPAPDPAPAPSSREARIQARIQQLVQETPGAMEDVAGVGGIAAGRGNRSPLLAIDTDGHQTALARP